MHSKHACRVFVGCKSEACPLCWHSVQNECSSMKFKRAFEDEVISTECSSKDVWVELLPSLTGNGVQNPENLGVEVTPMNS
jgi:hypothetical protein